MTVMQKTIFGETVPVTSHRDDIVICSDDKECRREDAITDCEGGFHSDDEARKEANAEIVGKILEGWEKWAVEYCTENDDYANCYDSVINEGSHNWNDLIKKWFEDHYGDELDFEHDDYLWSEFMDHVAESVSEELDGPYDCEPEYHSNEYAAYDGKGCCLDSCDVGEYEVQIDVNNCEKLKALHDAGELDDVLDEVESDYSNDYVISRSHRREKNEKTGYYENAGRKTYLPYDHSKDCPTFEIYTMPGGQWQFVVPADRMEELVTEAVMEYFGYEDE